MRSAVSLPSFVNLRSSILISEFPDSWTNAPGINPRLIEAPFVVRTEVARVNFAFGRDRLEMISFRVAENDVASHEKHDRHRRASDSFRASVCQQAKTEREHAAK